MTVESGAQGPTRECRQLIEGNIHRSDQTAGTAAQMRLVKRCPEIEELGSGIEVRMQGRLFGVRR
jgi:hypothetical protein